MFTYQADVDFSKKAEYLNHSLKYLLRMIPSIETPSTNAYKTTVRLNRLQFNDSVIDPFEEPTDELEFLTVQETGTLHEQKD